MTTSTQVASANEWMLSEQAQRIKVFTKPVDGSDIKAVKAVTTIATSIDSLIAVILDTRGWRQWVHRCERAKVLQEEGFSRRHVYQVTNLPWPATDRDMILNIRFNHNREKGHVNIKAEAVPELIPEKDKYVRIEKSDAVYTLEPRRNDVVQVTWVQHTDPAGSLPDWLVNDLLIDTPIKTLSGLRSIVKKKKYQESELRRNEKGVIIGWSQKKF